MPGDNKHFTLFPGALDKGNLTELPDPLRSAKQIVPEVPTKLKRKRMSSTPPKLPLKIRVTPQPPSSSNDAPSTPPFCKKESPWKTYQAIVPDDEAGAVIVAHVHHFTFKVVAIKERGAVNDKKLESLRKLQHNNIVHFLAAFQEESRLYLVYESVRTSLSEVQGCSYGPLKEFELAAVCKQVLHGLIFLLRELMACPVALDTTQVLLEGDGNAKIANAADAILQGKDQLKDDTQLAHLLFELMEPGSYMADPSTLDLTNPARWSLRIRDFLKAARRDSLSKLAEDPFLETSPGPGCLVPYVETVMRGKTGRE